MQTIIYAAIAVALAAIISAIYYFGIPLIFGVNFGYWQIFAAVILAFVTLRFITASLARYE